MTKRDFMILLLALTGAGVDAAVIMGFNVLTAAQTGNTILLAVALARGQLALGISAAVSVVAYVIGAAMGEFFIVRHSDSRPGPSGIARTLVAEIVFLAGLVFLWHAAGPTPSCAMISALVALAAVAMGMQSAAVRQLHAGPTTTYITGLLTSFTTGMIQWMLAGTNRSGAQPTRDNPGSSDKSSDDKSWKYGVVWATYVVGAIVSGLLYLHAGEMALLLPIAATATVIALDPRHC